MSKRKHLFSLLIRKKTLIHILRRGISLGWCPICEKSTLFYKEGEWLRDQFRCIRCYSIPRQRALASVLNRHFPNYRELLIHESSPGGSASAKFARECQNYIPTHYFPDTPLGQVKNGYRCEDLEKQTFTNESFDLVITQDVLEHLMAPAKALAEIERTLKPGGAHVFTVPWYYWKDTAVRAVREVATIHHLMEPEYHGNPIDPKGSLVVTEWGYDLCDFIYQQSGMTTTAVRIFDRRLGIEAKFIEVFISRKADRLPERDF
jgi:SAM-dependent methyltransferase